MKSGQASAACNERNTVSIHPDAPLKRDAANMELPPMPLAPEQILGGDPIASGVVLWRPDPKSLRRNGIWEHTPGKSDYHQEPQEVSAFAFFSGKATITPEGHDPMEVGPGDVIFLTEGTTTVWDVEETIRAFYWVHE
jgi:uncharacterized cupin superfamily protein